MDLNFVQIDINNKNSMTLFDEFYNKILVPNFKKSELETPDQLKEQLSDKNLGYNYYMSVVLDKSSNIVAGIIFDYFPKTNTGLIEYIATSHDFRQHGIGSYCLKFVSEILNKNATNNNSNRVNFVCGEVEKIMNSKQSKHYFWEKFGFKRLDFNYIQPALDESKSPVKIMDFGIMTKFPGAEFNQASISTETLMSILKDYYGEDNKVVIKMCNEISKKGNEILLNL